MQITSKVFYISEWVFGLNTCEPPYRFQDPNPGPSPVRGTSTLNCQANFATVFPHRYIEIFYSYRIMWGSNCVRIQYYIKWLFLYKI